MSATHYFHGEFTVHPPLSPEHCQYLQAFQGINHYRHDAEKAVLLDDPFRIAAGLLVGEQGIYYVGEDQRTSRLPEDRQPYGIPGRTCPWWPDDEGVGITHIDTERWDEADNWLIWLVEHLLHPWGYTLEGQVTWEGSEPGDNGTLYAHGLLVEAVQDRTYNPGPSWNRRADIPPDDGD